MTINNQWDDYLFRKFDPYAHAKYSILLNWMGPLIDQRILVIGSGSGEFACMLAKLGAVIQAIDISSESIELTQQTAVEYGVDIQTQVSSLETFESNCKFNWVIATDVIEHIQDDKHAMNKIESFVCDKGKLLITVPAMQSLFGHHDRILGHYRRYSKKSLMKLSGQTLSIQKIRYFGFCFIPVTFIISRVLKISYPIKNISENVETSTFIGKLITFILNVEKKVHFPLGTSLLLMAENVSEQNPG